MARIRTVRGPDATRVTISGSLAAADVGRLEQSCAPALTAARLHLEIELRDAVVADGTAAAFLDRLRTRGALIRTSRSGLSHEPVVVKRPAEHPRS